MDMQQADPKGLIRESYAIEGITAGECRSIFMDWALSLAAETSVRAALAVLIENYTPGNAGHPMNSVLTDGLSDPPLARRRGGRAGRQNG